MAAKPVAELGLAGLLHRKGEGRGVDPQYAVRGDEPSGEAVVTAMQDAARDAPVPEANPVRPEPAPPLAMPPALTGQGVGGLIGAMKSRHTVPTKNCQVRLPDPVARLLRMWSMLEDISQQEIMEAAITAAVREWEEKHTTGAS